VLFTPDWQSCQYLSAKGEYKMSMPKTIAGWCTVLFFLFYGLAAFIPAAASMPWLTGILALGAAVFTFLGR